MKKQKYGTIYILKNKINGKMYVGQTTCELKPGIKSLFKIFINYLK
jgi:hypothetical protein